jgi:hypothetical protein
MRPSWTCRWGVGYKKLRPEELTKDAAGAVVTRTVEPSESGAIGTAGVNYSQALTSITTLTDKLLIESGSSAKLKTVNLVYAF